ncbi:MAG: S8 family serine peptidase, partial [Gammaproteobacteria bacterium]|nr:S8 family serine peptidase [Gammaproteobacteria bacterium]
MRVTTFAFIAGLPALLLSACGGGGGDSGPPPPPPEPPASVTIEAGSLIVSEWDDRTPVDITLNLDRTVAGSLTVRLGASGTATPGGDFDLADTEIVIPGGSTSGKTTFTPIRDFEEEGDESVTISIDSVAGNGNTGATSSVSLDLVDQGALFADSKENLYAELFANLITYDITDDSISFLTGAFNLGAVSSSGTRLSLRISTHSDFSDPELTISGKVPPLEPYGDSVYYVHTITRDQLSGPGNYYALLIVDEAEEEIPESRFGNFDFSGFTIGDDRLVRTTCKDFGRNSSPGQEDPLLAEQWHLENTGQSAYANTGGEAGEDLGMSTALTQGPTGTGVQVAVVDTGLETCHPDLSDNVEAGASYNFNTRTNFRTGAMYWANSIESDPFNPGTLGDHGTSVAGIIAASANNGIGGRGVAPTARLRGYNFLNDIQFSSSHFDSLGASDQNPDSTDAHIFNMSYGTSGSESNVGLDLRAVLRNGVTNLRSNRGAVYVKSAGNAFNACSSLVRYDAGTDYNVNDEIGCVSSNGDPTNNLPYVLAIGGFSANGKRSSYSSTGANLWVSAPAGQYGRENPAIITTDQMESDRGYDALSGAGLPVDATENPHGDYVSTFNGTSSAAPNTSGAIALLLEAAPELTWRDVKYILAKTARQIDPDIPPVRIAFGGEAAVLRHGWITNAAGYHFHNWYGFGAV